MKESAESFKDDAINEFPVEVAGPSAPKVCGS